MGLESPQSRGRKSPRYNRPSSSDHGRRCLDAWVKEQKHDREDLAKFKKLKIKFEAENLLKYWSRQCGRRPSRWWY